VNAYNNYLWQHDMKVIYSAEHQHNDFMEKKWEPFINYSLWLHYATFNSHFSQVISFALQIDDGLHAQASIFYRINIFNLLINLPHSSHFMTLFNLVKLLLLAEQDTVQSNFSPFEINKMDFILSSSIISSSFVQIWYCIWSW